MNRIFSHPFHRVRLRLSLYISPVYLPLIGGFRWGFRVGLACEPLPQINRTAFACWETISQVLCSFGLVDLAIAGLSWPRLGGGLWYMPHGDGHNIFAQFGCRRAGMFFLFASIYRSLSKCINFSHRSWPCSENQGGCCGSACISQWFIWPLDIRNPSLSINYGHVEPRSLISHSISIRLQLSKCPRSQTTTLSLCFIFFLPVWFVYSTD